MLIWQSAVEGWREAWIWLKRGLYLVLPLLGALYGLFKLWLEKKLDRRFKEQLAEIEAKRTAALEDLKHEHTKELEHLRSTIQALYSRISKIHEKEFEVLPRAWLYLHEAYGAAVNLMSRLRSIYKLDATPTDSLEEHMTSLKFSDAEKQLLRSASDKQETYRTIWESKLLLDAEERQRILTNYLIEHRIFMDDELRTAFDSVNKSLIHAVTLYATGKGFDAKMVTEASQELHGLESKIADVEKAVQKRLRYYDA